MRCGIAIKRNDTRGTPLCLQGLSEEEFGSRYIATGLSLKSTVLPSRSTAR
jgi:hypothetical protein